VFSRDGKKLVWRANHPLTPETEKRYHDLLKDNLTSPMKMELFVADGDGKHTRQITNFGCASFAPTFTPDGKKILFASNKHDCDGRKFELYLIDADGKNRRELGGAIDNRQHEAGWAPNGKSVLVLVQERGDTHLYRIPADGGKPVVVVSDPGIVSSWSAHGDQIAYSFSSPSDLAAILFT